MHLYEALGSLVQQWRNQHYACEEYPAIAEILEWATHPDVSSFRLRAPQLRALEIYWYLRLKAGTAHIFDLYRKVFPKRADLLAALGIPTEAFERVDFDMEVLWTSIRQDDAFVHDYHLEALRETLALEYPSYILALAMGAGKTVLIGAIFASEFAMAQEYPDSIFVENALVFAPGKTIIESLRELAEMRYEAVLPPRLYKSFAAALKLTFTRDGDPTIPVTPNSQFNVIVTNTEKIRIQKETIRKSDLGALFSRQVEDEARAEIANLRLQAIASLPKLAIFSDEAHHTYGQALDQDLKKVRQTVDYLNNPFPQGSAEHAAHASRLVCVVNTTGTPYYQHQPLRDVVIWYGLSEGIRDGILKELAGNILGFDFEGNVEDYLAYVVEDFFREYGEVALPDGTPAKLAIFFPQTDDVQELRPVIEAALARSGESPTVILEHHTKNDNKADFDRFRSKDSPHRVALLVDRGVEGWNVPALFACALARRLRSSNNFVLQATSRCLRQVPGNQKKARIYLSSDNKNILDKQLQETYGEGFADLTQAQVRSRTWTITLRKVDVPPLVVRKTVRSVQARPQEIQPIRLVLPQVTYRPGLTKTTYTVAETPGTERVLQQDGEKENIDIAPDTLSLYAAAAELGRTYRLDGLEVLGELRRIYAGQDEILSSHLAELARQIETQRCDYEVIEETVEVALALVKPAGFQHNLDGQGHETYTAEISYPVDREQLLAAYKDWQAHAGQLGFHYDPYNFDSQPERNFFDMLLGALRQHPDEVEDVYFTGGLTDPQKTDFYVEYKGEDAQWHRYTPDFVIRRKDGKCLIVEIKSAHERQHPVDGEHGSKAMATQKWVGLNPERLKYQMIFVERDEVGYEQLSRAKEFLDES
jgi:type III restriction enzyme